MKHVLLVTLVLLVAAVSAIFIQAGINADVTTNKSSTQTATLQVVVNDDAGNLIKSPPATVTATNSTTNQQLVVSKPNAVGYYLVHVPAGSYAVTAEVAGYATQSQDVVASTGQILPLTFNLIAE